MGMSLEDGIMEWIFTLDFAWFYDSVHLKGKLAITDYA
jgi:hypothetical protein